MQLVAIADDTTGALEAGGQLALGGVRALVTTENFDLEREAVVVDAHTRHMPADLARETVARLASTARQAGVRYLFKKTDSTLRGNIASEFRALLDEFPDRPLVYVPAYPKMGRTVKGGELLVNGKPLAETAIARDPLNPVRNGSIPAMLSGSFVVSLADSSQVLRRSLETAPLGSVLVCDGTTDADLADAATVIGSIDRPCLVAGTAGFVGYWLSSLPVKRDYTAPALRIARCLIVSGSLHPASLEQVSRAAAAGLPAIYLSERPEQDAQTVLQLAAILKAGGWPAIATPGTCPKDVGLRIGAIVRRVLEAESVDCLVVFGGDTTLAILNALGIALLASQGELVPGIPVSTAGYCGGSLTFVTKAGGFGTAGALISLKELLEKHR